MGMMKTFAMLVLLPVLISCGGGGGSSTAGVTAVSSTDLTTTGVSAMAVQDEGDTLTVLSGGSSSATLALETDATTTTSDLVVTVVRESSNVGVSAAPATVPVTVKVTQNATTGVWTLTSTTTSDASGAYPFTVKVTNTKTGKSALSTFKINAAAGQAVASSMVSGSAATTTLTTSAGHSFVIDKGTLTNNVGVQVVQTTTAGGKILTRLVFDQDVSTKNVSVILPIIPVTTPAAASAACSLVVYGCNKTLLGNIWKDYRASFLNAGDHRLPDGVKLPLANTFLTALTTKSEVDLPARSYIASRLTSVAQCNPSTPTASCSLIALPADTEPVLFVHGFLVSPTTASLGGGKGTWANFPALVSASGGIGASKKKFLPFEFQWATDARFEDVAIDLAKAINEIKNATGKNVHVIAHSFGGVLVRTLLQKQTVNYPAQWTSTVDDAVASVASLVTLGSPHSGIGDVSTGATFPGSIPKFPNGQDAATFDGCRQVSCHQMGETVSLLNSALGLNSQPGEIAAKLFNTAANLPRIPIVVGIGLTRYGQSDTFDKGDLLISYAGQRLLPTNSLSALKQAATVGNATVYETILGTVSDVKPGDTVGDYASTSRSFGYVHSSTTGVTNLSGLVLNTLQNVDGMRISLSNSVNLPIGNLGQVYGLEAAPASANCVTTNVTANMAAATCDHAGFLLFRDLMDSQACAFMAGGVCITNVQNDNGSVKVAITDGGTANDATPLLTGTVAGTVAGGKVVRIYDGSTFLGNATVSATSSVDRRGWTFTPPAALSAGTHALRAVTTSDSNTTPIGGGVSWTVTVTAPISSLTATITTTQNNDTSPATNIANNGTTTDMTPRLSGTLTTALSASQTLRVYDGTTLLGSAVVSGANWSFQISAPLSLGAHVFTLKITRADGIEGPTSNAWNINIQAPTLQIPQLVSPGHPSSPTTLASYDSVAFSWASVASAASYSLKIYDSTGQERSSFSPATSSLTQDLSSLVASYGYSPNYYSWKVSACNASNACTNLSAPFYFKFSVPTVVNPTVTSSSVNVTHASSGYQDVAIAGSGFTSRSWHQLSTDSGSTWYNASSAPYNISATAMTVAVNATLVVGTNVRIRVCAIQSSNGANCSSNFAIASIVASTPSLSSALIGSPYAANCTSGASGCRRASVTLSGVSLNGTTDVQINWGYVNGGSADSLLLPISASNDASISLTGIIFFDQADPTGRCYDWTFKAKKNNIFTNSVSGGRLCK